MLEGTEEYDVLAHTTTVQSVCQSGFLLSAIVRHCVPRCAQVPVLIDSRIARTLKSAGRSRRRSA